MCHYCEVTLQQCQNCSYRMADLSVTRKHQNNVDGTHGIVYCKILSVHLKFIFMVIYTFCLDTLFQCLFRWSRTAIMEVHFEALRSTFCFVSQFCVFWRKQWSHCSTSRRKNNPPNVLFVPVRHAPRYINIIFRCWLHVSINFLLTCM